MFDGFLKKINIALLIIPHYLYLTVNEKHLF